MGEVTRTMVFCSSVEKTPFNARVKFCSAYDGSEEVDAFLKGLPMVNVDLDIRDWDIVDRFIPGQRYYLDLAPA